MRDPACICFTLLGARPSSRRIPSAALRNSGACTVARSCPTLKAGAKHCRKTSTFATVRLCRRGGRVWYVWNRSISCPMVSRGCCVFSRFPLLWFPDAGLHVSLHHTALRRYHSRTCCWFHVWLVRALIGVVVTMCVPPVDVGVCIDWHTATLRG